MSGGLAERTEVILPCFPIILRMWLECNIGDKFFILLCQSDCNAPNPNLSLNKQIERHFEFENNEIKSLP